MHHPLLTYVTISDHQTWFIDLKLVHERIIYVTDRFMTKFCHDRRLVIQLERWCLGKWMLDKVSVRCVVITGCGNIEMVALQAGAFFSGPLVD
jgi:hypothetical protein